MIFNIINLIWAYRKKHYGGVAIGIYSFFSIWFSRDGFEITISKPTYKKYPLWIRKYDISYFPFKIYSYRQ
jgi:hypothetical protein